MGLLRDLITGWSHAHYSGVEPPRWLGLALAAPGVVGLALLPAPGARYVVAALALAVPAIAIVMLASRPVTPFSNPRDLVALALSLGTFAIVGHLWSPAVAVVGTPIALALTPVLARVQGTGLDALGTLLWARRHLARTRAWLANPDDTALHLHPVRHEPDVAVYRVAGTGREIVVETRHPSPSFMEHEYLVFEPALVADERPGGAFRGEPRERLARGVVMPIRRHDEGATLALWLGDILAGLAMIAVAQAMVVALAIGATRIVSIW